MGGYADVKHISDDLTAPEVDKSSLDDCLDDAGWELQAINWAFEKITGESLVEKIITPLTGDWSKIHADGDAWRSVGDSMSTISYNLTTNVGTLREHWDGEAAKTHEAYIALVWKSALFAEKEVANLVGKGFDKIADGSEELGKQAAKLLEYIIKKVEDAIEKAWIPFYGWVKAAEYVWDAYQVYEKIVALIETLKKLIEDVKALFGGIGRIASALGKIKDVNSVADAAAVEQEITGGAGDIKDASGDLKDDAGDAKDDVSDVKGTVHKYGSTTPAPAATAPAA